MTRFLSSFFRYPTAAALCLLLAGQPLLAEPAPVVRVAPLTGDARILHALNRFTFGPRPGDLAAVQQLGLKRWFEAQLDPGTIDDSALDARLASFPAMKLAQADLMERFPPPALLRIIETGKLPLPSDPTLHAIYADQIAFYQQAQARKAAKTADAATTPKPATPADDGIAGNMTAAAKAEAAEPDPAAPPPTDHLDRFFSGLEAVKILNLPPNDRMARLLSMSPQDLLHFRESLTPQELAAAADGLSPEQKEMLAALPGSLRVVSSELLQTRLLRDIYSQRQLEAVMTDFWLNHFNIHLRKNQNEPYLLPAFERDTIRPHALGHFEDLLRATAESPAMQMYLDNWQSIGPDSEAAARSARQLARNPEAKARPSGLNENYARELMELHTLGVDGGYTQADVTEVAKVFTGWTIDKPYRGAAFTFDPARHEPGKKQVLSWTINPNAVSDARQSGTTSGQAEGLQVLHLLATSPATARFISTKLAIRFVADEPPPTLIDRMAKTFLTTDGDIKAVLRTLFNSPEFWSPSIARAKVKTPLEFVVSAARATQLDVTNAQPLVGSLDKLGMPLYGMQTPNGYSWLSEPWVSTGALVSRMNFALLLTADRLPGSRVGLAPTLASPSAAVHAASLPQPSGIDPDLAAREQRLELLLLGEPVSDRTRATVLEQFGSTTAQQQAERDFPIRVNDPDPIDARLAGGQLERAPAIPPQRLDRPTGTMAGLLLGSPEFQRR